MIHHSKNKLFERDNKNLIPAFFKKAIISSINQQNLSASVYIVGNSQTIINNIPFSTSVDVSKVQVGDRCRVDCFDESNPSDMVIAYVYSKPFRKTFTKGSADVGAGGIAIPHGMGVTPDIVGIIRREAGDVFEYQDADDTYIYLQSASGTITTDWYTLKF